MHYAPACRRRRYSPSVCFSMRLLPSFFPPFYRFYHAPPGRVFFRFHSGARVHRPARPLPCAGRRKYSMLPRKFSRACSAANSGRTPPALRGGSEIFHPAAISWRAIFAPPRKPAPEARPRKPAPAGAFFLSEARARRGGGKRRAPPGRFAFHPLPCAAAGKYSAPPKNFRIPIDIYPCKW